MQLERLLCVCAAQLDLPMPQLIFHVSGGDTTQTWHFRKPNGYDLEKQFKDSKSAADTDEATNLERCGR